MNNLPARYNKQHYTFGGKSPIKNSTLHRQMTGTGIRFNTTATPSNREGPLVQRRQGSVEQLHRPKHPKAPAFYNQAYKDDSGSIYARKSKTIERMRTYAPNDPYAVKERRLQEQNQRFNEDFSQYSQVSRRTKSSRPRTGQSRRSRRVKVSKAQMSTRELID